MGDGWFPLLEPGEAAQAVIAQLHAYAREAGRDPQSLGISVYLPITKIGWIHDRSTDRKTPDELRREVAAWEELGVTHLTIDTVAAGLASPREHIEAIQFFKEEVGLGRPV
jgi:alkanesulfonate monooxygenase SsuD/methylene tetrahydromethanopterin reductase-like flavin-dependent oxidoreductase (luciferase family)